METNESLFSVAGARVLITGSTRGIGHAIASEFARRGATVFITGRTLSAAADVAATLGPNCHGYELDVASEESVLACAGKIDAEHGGVDVLINNAGIDPHYASLDKTSTEDWMTITRVNLDGVFYCCKHLTGSMLARGKGNIINISSIGGRIGLKRQVPYCAAKGGVEQITRSLAVDWAEQGIRVNGIGYGFVETDLTTAMTTHQHLAPRLLSRIPLGRFAHLGEVAGAAVFLASPSASYITGSTIVVDGGWTAA
jgi:gluconate 5-dehydrogenase